MISDVKSNEMCCWDCNRQVMLIGNFYCLSIYRAQMPMASIYDCHGEELARLPAGTKFTKNFMGKCGKIHGNLYYCNMELIYRKKRISPVAITEYSVSKRKKIQTCLLSPNSIHNSALQRARVITWNPQTRTLSMQPLHVACWVLRAL